MSEVRRRRWEDSLACSCMSHCDLSTRLRVRLNMLRVGQWCATKFVLAERLRPPRRYSLSSNMDGDDVDEPIQIELEAADAVPALSFTRTLTQSDHSPVSAESPKSLRIPLRPLPRRQTDPSSPGPSVTSPLKRDDSSVTSGILSHRTIATIHRHAGARDEIKLVEMERRSTRGPLQLRDLFRKRADSVFS